jgi:hypothetical protein
MVILSSVLLRFRECGFSCRNNSDHVNLLSIAMAKQNTLRELLKPTKTKLSSNHSTASSTLHPTREAKVMSISRLNFSVLPLKRSLTLLCATPKRSAT